jgi:hypothetical protein
MNRTANVASPANQSVQKSSSSVRECVRDIVSGRPRTPVFYLNTAYSAQKRRARPQLGFAIMTAVNSVQLVPPSTKNSVTLVSAFFFATALVALGLETDLKKLRQRDLRPLLAGVLAWLFISIDLGLIQML